MNCKDLLNTKIDRYGIKVSWIDEETVILDNGEETTIYRIYFSYGYNIFVLEYFDQTDRNVDYNSILGLTR